MPGKDAISAGFGNEFLGGLSSEIRIRQPGNKLKGTAAAKPPDWLTAHPDTGRYPNHKLVDIQPATSDTIDLIYEAIPTTPKIEESIDAELGIVKKYTYRNKYGATLPTIGATAINSLTLTTGDYVHRAAENLIGGMMAEVTVTVVTPASAPTRDKTEINDRYGSYVVYEKFVRNADVTLLAKGVADPYGAVDFLVLNDELVDTDGTFGTRKTTVIKLANCPERVSKITDKDYGYVYLYERFGLASRTLQAFGAAYGIGTVLNYKLADEDGTFADQQVTVLPSETGTQKNSQDIDKIFCVSHVVTQAVPSATAIPERGDAYSSGGITGYVLEASLKDDDGVHATMELKITSSNSATFYEYKLDMETGLIYSERTVYTLGPTQPDGVDINTSAEYTETKRLDCNFWLATRSKTTTLTTESYEVVVPGKWPAVLEDFTTTPLYLNSGVVDRYLVDYNLKKAYIGACNGLYTRTWSKNIPDVTATETMIPEGIYFDGIFLNVRIPESLHIAITITETTGTGHPTYAYLVNSKTFDATNYTTWPASYVADCNIERYRGGFIKETLLVYAPS